MFGMLDAMYAAACLCQCINPIQCVSISKYMDLRLDHV